jgi:hypothetical protein
MFVKENSEKMVYNDKIYIYLSKLISKTTK